MHPTAMSNCQSFFTTYSASLAHHHHHVKVVEIGSQNVNGTLRDTCPTNFEYIGVDFAQAKGVDVVLEDPYKLPFENESVDVILSSSCFEHSEMFWLVFLEILRVLKPNGLFYLNAPSTGSFHRYPVDCWRFYPDSGAALVKWAQRHGNKPVLLESYTQKEGNWQDYVAVFLKDESCSTQFPKRILDTKIDFENGQLMSDDKILNFADICQQERLLQESEHRSAAKDLIALRQIDDLASKVEELKKTEMEQLQAHKLAQNVITDLKMQISQLQTSKSWRLTAPLRAFKKILIK
jgi:SAM-dependent methyltransferase